MMQPKMLPRPEDLPDFGAPPVAEVAMQVHFDPLPGLKSLHVGDLFNLYRKAYPQFEQHDPVEPAVEVFEEPASSPSLGIRLHAKLPETHRVWFVSADGANLIQIQPQQFTRNWRQTRPDQIYPRFESVFTSFADEVRQFDQWAAATLGRRITVRQCEIAYINALRWLEPEKSHEMMPRMLRFWRDTELAPGVGQPEDGMLALRFRIHDDKGSPRGRLLVNCQPAYDGNKQPMVQLIIAARGMPAAPTIDAALDFIEIGRQHIVRSFAAITSDEIQASWERRK